MECWINGNHVNLAEHRIGVVMNFGPTESSELVVDFVQHKAVRIKPRLSKTCRQGCVIPSTLFGVMFEGAIIDGEPSLFVLTLHECAHCYLGFGIAAR